jgi:glycosyltransferase involved in cell wall biosynthesis
MSGSFSSEATARLRILLVSPLFAPDLGGVESVVLRLASELVHAGHEVTVVTQGKRGLPRRDLVRAYGAEVEVFRAPALPGVPREFPAVGLYRLVRHLARRVDVVHVHSYHTLVAPVAVAASRGCPMVLSLHYHGGGHDRLRSAAHRLYRRVGVRLVGAAHRVQANSQAEAALVVRDFAEVLRSCPEVIWHGVDPLVEADPFPLGRPVVLCVGRLEGYKRVDVLIEAASRWRSSAELVVVGDGPDRPRLEALAHTLNAPVRFCGRVDDGTLARWWATTDVLAAASEQESFGLTVAQAITAGISVLASPIAAHQELLTVTGTSPVGSWEPQEWADSVDAALMLEHPEARAVGTWADSASRVVDLYRQAITDRFCQEPASGTASDRPLRMPW